MSTNKAPMIDPTKYKAFLKQYIKDLYDIDAPMIAGAVERCLQKLEDQPTIDVVEVVRCKDCEHNVDGRCYGGQDICAEEGYDFYVADTDFCSYGERRAT